MTEREIDRQAFAVEHGMTIDFVNWFFDHKKNGCGNSWFIMSSAMWEGWKAALASQQPADDGWIEWGGGENPAEGKLVQVEYRDGFVNDEQPSGSYRWYHEPNNCDIIAYRVVKP